MRLQWPPVNDLIHQNASIASSCITTQSVHFNFDLPYQRRHSSGIYTLWVFHKVLAQIVPKVKSIHCGETSPISSEETTFLAPVPYCPPRCTACAAQGWLRKGRSRARAISSTGFLPSKATSRQKAARLHCSLQCSHCSLPWTAPFTGWAGPPTPPIYSWICTNGQS